jgi:hypothetical protein
MIELVALACFFVCIGFTIVAARERDESGGQSGRDSMIEAWQNIAVGFAINWAVNLILLPYYIGEISVWDAFLMGWPYTTVSLLRSFSIRRWNNNKTKVS